jgi:surface protein
MEGLFNGCSKFNSSLKNWDVSNVETMYDMFDGCTVFNPIHGLSAWDVSKVQDMSYMFNRCTVFNQDISNWDVSQVRSMYEMFYQCIAFNPSHGLARWNVSQVFDMEYMFYGCTLFNQDISKWNISNVGIPNDYNGNMTNMLTGTAFSTKNYSKLLKAWAQLPVQEGIDFDTDAVIDPKYQKYKDHLVQVHNWDI